MHPLDEALAREHMTFFRQIQREKGLSEPRILPIEPGDVIDLGGLTVEVIHLPGHTQGSILLLLREDRVLFTGDAINMHLWLQLQGCLTPCEYLAELDKVMYLREKADYILHGHDGHFQPIALMEQLRQGLWELYQGQTQEDTDYHYFGGTARQHPYDGGRAVIVYPKSGQTE